MSLTSEERKALDAARYHARRRSIFVTRMRLQVSGERISEADFNIEYDAACDKLILEQKSEYLIGRIK